MQQIYLEMRSRLYLLFGLLGLMWFVHLANEVVLRFGTSSTLYEYGIEPHHAGGLKGVLFAPFLHGNFPHLIGNSFAFVCLGGLILISGRVPFLATFFLSMLAAGLGTWFFASPGTSHIGASGIVFGFLGFLLFRGWFHRRIWWITLAVVALLAYYPMLAMLVNQDAGISWHGHFFGFVGGVVAARLSPWIDRVFSPPTRNKIMLVDEP